MGLGRGLTTLPHSGVAQDATFPQRCSPTLGFSLVIVFIINSNEYLACCSTNQHIINHVKPNYVKSLTPRCPLGDLTPLLYALSQNDAPTANATVRRGGVGLLRCTACFTSISFPMFWRILLHVRPNRHQHSTFYKGEVRHAARRGHTDCMMGKDLAPHCFVYPSLNASSKCTVY